MDDPGGRTGKSIFIVAAQLLWIKVIVDAFFMIVLTTGPISRLRLGRELDTHGVKHFNANWTVGPSFLVYLPLGDCP